MIITGMRVFGVRLQFYFHEPKQVPSGRGSIVPQQVSVCGMGDYIYIVVPLAKNSASFFDTSPEGLSRYHSEVQDGSLSQCFGTSQVCY